MVIGAISIKSCDQHRTLWVDCSLLNPVDCPQSYHGVKIFSHIIRTVVVPPGVMVRSLLQSMNLRSRELGLVRFVSDTCYQIVKYMREDGRFWVSSIILAH